MPTTVATQIQADASLPLVQLNPDMSDLENPLPVGEKTVQSENGNSPIQPIFALPTLQRNALRKIFERAIFTPDEVAELGVKRLLLADSIGQKGLKTIVQWLSCYGLKLKQTEEKRHRKRTPEKKNDEIKNAVRILRANGYIVYRRRKETDSKEENHEQGS